LGNNIKRDLGRQGSEDLVSSQVVRDKIKC